MAISDCDKIQIHTLPGQGLGAKDIKLRYPRKEVEHYADSLHLQASMRSAVPCGASLEVGDQKLYGQ